MRSILWTATATAAVLLAGGAFAATPAQNCASSKNKEAAQYAECRQKVEGKFALRGDAAARAAGLARCAARYDAKWPQIESRAGGACPSNGDQTGIRQHVADTTTDVATALAGGPLGGQARPLATGQTGCWNASGQPIPCTGTGQDGELRQGAERAYVDNGDGTITDTATGLMWEKLSDDTSIHDKDNTYTWANAFAYKIATLNQEGFAGHRDWRVPNVSELLSIVDYGRAGPAAAFDTGCVEWCTVLNCSCTLGTSTYWFWTSTSFHLYPGNVWRVFMYNGVADRSAGPTQSFAVRAVRGGS